MFRLLSALLLGALAMNSAAMNSAATDWTTPAEATQFRSTPSYAETVAFLERLQQAAPDKLKLEIFGSTPQGRPMTVVIASGDGTFTPEAARAAHKPVVLVQAGIHPGEIEGKDAGLMLLRDFAVTNKLPHLLDDVVLVFIPVFSVDGHEQSSAYNRINQNGPASMGFRGQSQYLNLNRDYIKADSAEMRAWLKLWQRWGPDILIDVHTTDGADYQYDLTWYTEDADKLPKAVAEWQRDTIVETVLPQFEERAHLASMYLNFKDARDPTKGIVNFGSGPRYSTGYAALQNRPALLLETHMLKPYATRVDVAYDMLELMLKEVGKHPQALLAANAKADAAALARAKQDHATLALTFKRSDESTPFEFKGYAFSLSHSEISDSDWIQYHRDQAKTWTIPNWNDLEPAIVIDPPAAYAVPAQWNAIIERLDAHGIEYQRLDAPARIQAQGYQLDNPQWAQRPFEGHLMLKSFEITPLTDSRELPVGSVIVPMKQHAARLAIELLEPQAADSLLHWGYLNAIFEAKEYAEPRVLEKLARDMLEKNPELKNEFALALAQNPELADQPYARLYFFYKRSPWYQVQHVGRYPVLRLDAAALKALQSR